VKGSTYIRYEVLRTFRNRRFLIFSLVFPLVLFFSIAGSNRHAHLLGIPFPLYYMTGMAAWGTMIAVVSGGARIANERSIGWTRQMRVTPLPTRAYFGAKILSSYLLALLSIAALSLAGTSLGVRLSTSEWLTMIGLILVGLIPLAALGILLGHLLTVDSIGPAIGGSTSLLALLGGAYGPIFSSGVLLRLVKGLPSYWLVQAGKTALGGAGWPAEGWIVIAAWSVVLTLIATRVYRRDTARL
jgi:ABC-2 type transport system permease protein